MHSFRRVKKWGWLDEAAQAEPVRQSEKDTHAIEGTETVHATVPKRSVDQKCRRSASVGGAEQLLYGRTWIRTASCVGQRKRSRTAL